MAVCQEYCSKKLTSENINNTTYIKKGIINLLRIMFFNTAD